MWCAIRGQVRHHPWMPQHVTPPSTPLVPISSLIRLAMESMHLASVWGGGVLQQVLVHPIIQCWVASDGYHYLVLTTFPANAAIIASLHASSAGVLCSLV
jgi:hypothetical protein